MTPPPRQTRRRGRVGKAAVLKTAVPDRGAGSSPAASARAKALTSCRGERNIRMEMTKDEEAENRHDVDLAQKNGQWPRLPYGS